MKKITVILFAVLVLSFCACGEGEAKEPVATQSQTVQTAQPTNAPEPTDVIVTEKSLKDTALEFIDKEVSELIAAIGEPVKSEYVGSCLGTGEDGVLSYEDFSVYTYKEGDSEIVRIVE